MAAGEQPDDDGRVYEEKPLSNKTKWLIAVALVLALTAVILAIVTGVIAATNKVQVKKEMCLTRQCIESAHAISSYLDTSVDPCTDFYNFACGGFLQKHRDPPFPSFASFDMLNTEAVKAVKNMLENPLSESKSKAVEKMKITFRSCKKDMSQDRNTAKKLAAEMERQGLGSKVASIENLLGDAIFDERDPFFALKMRKRKNFMISPPILPFYEDLDHYKSLMVHFLTHLNEPDVEEVVQDNMDILKKLKRIFSITRDDYDYMHYEIASLESTFPQVRWSQLVRYTMEKAGVDDFNVSSVTFFVDHTPSLTAVMNLITETPRRKLQNYLKWDFIYSLSRYLGQPFLRDYQLYNFMTADSEEEWSVEPVSDLCLSNIYPFFEKAITLEYAVYMFSKAMQDEVKHYFSEVANSFKESLVLNSWLDDRTTELIKKKVNDIGIEIGYPPSLIDIDKLDQKYKDVEIKENNFIFNIINLKKMKNENLLRTFQRMAWDFNPMKVNAFNKIYKNFIVIPISILFPPFYQVKRPQYLNFGAIGQILAHELGHSFDPNGITRGTKERWDESIVKEYRRRATCIVDQYSKYKFQHAGRVIKINGNASIGNDVADSIGMTHGFRAYLKHEAEHGKEPALPGLNYTNHQIYFMQYAQVFCTSYQSDELNVDEYSSPHSLGRFRVNGPVVNTPHFSDAFNCPLGSPMNPESKCHLWA